MGNATQTSMRWPQGWVTALEKLGEPLGGYSAFVRAVVWPVLTGRLKVHLDQDGNAVALEGRGSDGGKARILIDESQRPVAAAAEGIAPPIRMGRPKLSDTEKALRKLQKAAEAEGVSMEELQQRLGEGKPKRARKRGGL